MQPPTTVRCWELAAAELRGSVGTYMRWRSALRGQRCLIAIGIPTPPARYGRRGSLHATRFAPWRACPRHSINIQSLNAMVNELTVTHREGDRNDLRICRVCRCACGERARNRSTGAPGTTTCHELFCRSGPWSGRNGIAGCISSLWILLPTINFQKMQVVSYPIRTILSCSTAVTIAPSLDTSTE